MNKLFAMIDASNRGNFEKLTLHRMPGALPYAGRYRLIDFALSNIKNAGITNVAIFPFGNYRSLQDHIGSGKRWNLDRRKDGLFILPPKNMMMPSEDMLTFQRMHEHIEYFKRSTQAHCLIMPADLVWNINFNDVLKAHIESGADITEVMHENTRLQTFIIDKEQLLDYITNYDIIPYKTIHELILKKKQINRNIYNHRLYTKRIKDPYTYHLSNLDMLKFEIGNTIFSRKRPILTKEKTAPPARYTKTSQVSNSMISSGSLIQGKVDSSIIGRDVIIKEGAEVNRSIIMSNSVIEQGAILNNAIIDKGVVVKRDTVLEGSATQPFVTQKEQILTDQSALKVLFVGTEAYPYVKTGGLADVIGGLSRALSKKGLEVSVIIPLYEQVKKTYHETYENIGSKTFEFGGEERKVTVYKHIRKKIRFYFIENFKYFERENVYGYDDDCMRFAFFNLAVKEVLDMIGPFDLLHLHDWHTGLLPKILKTRMAKPPKTLLTIHNIDYQGHCDYTVAEALNIPLGEDGELNFLEEGINEATKLSTVSPTYRNELRYEYYGKNLTNALMKRERDFHGVLNGMPKEFSPQNDKVILSQYDFTQIFTKTENKLFLQEKMHLSLGLQKFIIGMVTRITEQKGFSLILEIMDEILTDNKDIQFVLLGTGEEKIISSLEKLARNHPGQVKLNFGYDATQPNYIYAGSDLFLMPSRVEPCGLGQMIALKYGTIPLVRKTGGLADSVTDYDPFTKEGNGFSFYHYDAMHLKERLLEAYDIFKNQKEDWKNIMIQAMKSDFSLDTQAQKMLEIYLTII